MYRLLIIGIIENGLNQLKTHHSHYIMFPIVPSISGLLSNHGCRISSHLEESQPTPTNPLIISDSATNILLTYQLINIFHSKSLSEPISLMSQDLKASEECTWCLVSDPSAQTNHRPLPILINADSQSFKYPNQWSMTWLPCRQLLPVTNWRKWFMSDQVKGEQGEGANSLHFTYYLLDVQGHSAVL